MKCIIVCKCSACSNKPHPCIWHRSTEGSTPGSQSTARAHAGEQHIASWQDKLPSMCVGCSPATADIEPHQRPDTRPLAHEVLDAIHPITLCQQLALTSPKHSSSLSPQRQHHSLANQAQRSSSNSSSSTPMTKPQISTPWSSKEHHP
jgi:hypothetical protein